MAKKKVHHEEHVDETWLIPYADMLTLLLALFIVMFAMSKIDQEKLQNVSDKFNVIFSGGSGVMEKNGNSVIPMYETPGESGEKGNAVVEDAKMKEIKKSVEQEIEDKGYSDKVKVAIYNEGLEITIQDVALFNSGEAEVLKSVQPLLLQITSSLSSLDNTIKVVGHTDNVPIYTSKFRSNWDLSAMRAINVMDFMVEKGKLKKENFSIQAYGEYRPIADNSTAEGKSKNRRVEIFIVRKYPLNDELAKNPNSNDNDKKTK